MVHNVNTSGFFQRDDFQYARIIFVLAAVFLGIGCSTAPTLATDLEHIVQQGQQRAPDDKVEQEELVGKASWYGKRHHGRTTANGESFDMHALTAAHKTLPFGTIVRVIDRNTRRSVVVRINDRGPYRSGRVIDLSKAAANQLRILKRGVAPVALEILSWGNNARVHRRKKASKARRAQRQTRLLQLAMSDTVVQLLALQDHALHYAQNPTKISTPRP